VLKIQLSQPPNTDTSAENDTGGFIGVVGFGVLQTLFAIPYVNGVSVNSPGRMYGAS